MINGYYIYIILKYCLCGTGLKATVLSSSNLNLGFWPSDVDCFAATAVKLMET